MKLNIGYIAIWLTLIAILASLLHLLRVSEAFTRSNRSSPEGNLESALTRPLYGSRFSDFEVSVNDCKVSYIRRDLSTCGDPGRLVYFNTFVDLTHFRIDNRLTVIDDFDPGGVGLISFKPRRKHEDVYYEAISSYEDYFQKQKRLSGPGSLAASTSSKVFLEENPIETLHAWEEVESCRGETWINLDRITMRIQVDNFSSLKAELEGLNEICSITK